MNDLEHFLPSRKFISTILALLMAGGAIAAAQYGTAPKDTYGTVAATTNDAIDKNWQDTLYAIQANNASSSLPAAPSDQTVADQLASARTKSLTETVSRSLAISLANAKQQGLGDDAVSQDKIIAQALSQAQSNVQKKYGLNDLTIVDDSTTTLHAYGNAIFAAMQKYPDINIQPIMLAVGKAVDTNDTSGLKQVPAAAEAYGSLAKALLLIPTPRSLASLHLIVVNDFESVSAALPGLQLLLSDPLQGIVSLQQVNTLLSEEGRVFISIAGMLQKRSILFSKDEPGATWGALLNITPTSQS